jgi:hypothetical protein
MFHSHGFAFGAGVDFVQNTKKQDKLDIERYDDV